MQAHKYSIKKWAKDDRPREKLLSKNPNALSDSELLAILINNGTRDKSAVELARELLQLGKDSLNELGKLSVKRLMTVKGIGIAKAITIAAAMELGRRRQVVNPIEKQVIGDSKAVVHYLQSLVKDLGYEVFGVVYLNRGNKVNHFEIISRGGVTATIADPRIIMKKALEEDAVSLILFHNHPSGTAKPSRADEELTIKIREAARYFDIRVLDHIIVTEDSYFSFADNGIL